ncbi:MAG: type II secretion system protein GspG [Deltaproteobacteria bacterium]|nr:type II secretion system protein GspG [Deltaproteobacteria bacterium]
MLIFRNANLFTIIFICSIFALCFILDTKKIRSAKVYILIIVSLLTIQLISFNVCTGCVYWKKDLSNVEEKHILVFSEILDQFKNDMGRYPLTDEGWSALITSPAGIKPHIWKGPYLSDIPKDHWKNELVYSSKDGKSFSLFSKGEDGLSASKGNDRDDINSWDTKKHWKSYYVEKGTEKKFYREILYPLVCALNLLLIAYFIIRFIIFLLQKNDKKIGEKKV